MQHYIDKNGWLWRDDNQVPVMPIDEHEYKQHIPLWLNARGRVLILGLGIGFCLPNLLYNKKVESITIVEKYPEVINLFEVHRPDLAEQVNIICADAMTYKPKSKFDTIWPDTFGEPVDILVKRYREFLEPGGWIGRWHHA